MNAGVVEGGDRRPGILLGFLAAATLVALTIAGRNLTFWSDEWSMFDSRGGWDVDGFVRPHQEHWIALPVLVYRVLGSIVGMTTYAPYLAVATILHLAVVAAVYRLTRRSAGAWVALALATVMLWLGSGFEDLYWAFQMAFLASVASGLWAIAALEVPGARRTLFASVLLTASVMSSGAAVPFLVSAGVELAMDPRRRRSLIALAPAAFVYGAWYVAYGRSGVASNRNPFSLNAIADMPGTVVTGLAHVAGSITGLGSLVGGVIFLVALAALAWRARRGWRPSPRTVGAVAGVVTAYGLTGLVRAQYFAGVIELPRYTYHAVALGLVGVAPLLAELRSDSRRRTLVLRAAGAVLLTTSLIWNVRLLIDGYAAFVDRAEFTKTLAGLGLRYADAQDVDAGRSLYFMSSPEDLERLDATVGPIPAYRDGAPPAFVDRAIPWLFETPIAVAESRGPGVGPLPDLLTTAGTTTVIDGPCVLLVNSTGPATAIVEIPQGGSITFTPDRSDQIMLSIALAGEPDTETEATVSAGARVTHSLRLPDLGDAPPWRLRLWSDDGLSGSLCGNER